MLGYQPADLQVTYHDAAPSGGPPRIARVRNISAGGVNLLVDQPCQPGDLLSIELPGAEGQPPYVALACVMVSPPRR